MATDIKAAAENSPDLLALLESVSRDTRLPDAGTELRLIEIDPHRAHVYWQLDGGKADATKPLYLRVHDITNAASIDEADQTYQIEVHGLSGRWYLDFWRDNRTFVTEIGQHDADGKFIAITRSNEIHTPVAEPVLAAPSAPVDPHGRPVLTELPDENKSTDEKTAKPDPADFLIQKFPFEEWFAEHNPLPDEKVIADEREVPAVRAAGEAAVVFAEEESDLDQSSLAQPFPAAEQLVQLHTENRAALEAFYEAAAKYPEPAPLSYEVKSAEVRHDPEPVPAEDLESRQPALALEHILGPSSLDSALRDLLMDLHAEIHVHGRVAAGRDMTLFGRTVQLNPDGTFSIRKKLVPGAWLLPLIFEHGAEE